MYIDKKTKLPVEDCMGINRLCHLSCTNGHFGRKHYHVFTHGLETNVVIASLMISSVQSANYTWSQRKFGNNGPVSDYYIVRPVVDEDWNSRYIELIHISTNGKYDRNGRKQWAHDRQTCVCDERAIRHLLRQNFYAFNSNDTGMPVKYYTDPIGFINESEWSTSAR